MILLYRYNSYIYKNYNGRGVSKIMSSLQKFHRRTQPFKVNTLHTGTVSISGNAFVGSVLTASNNIADVDGLGTFAYQWNRSGTAISGATASTYTLVTADNANTITVTITYTDGKGFMETETSAATASVINPPNDLVTVSSSVAGVGSGNDTTGYVLGSFSDGQKMYVAPKSTETSLPWGTHGTARGTSFVNNGLANTNTLAGFGQAAHPAAYAAKNLTTGGYNTWYLPAKNELNTLYSNKSATPFATANSFVGSYYWSSTETTGYNAWIQKVSNGGQYNTNKNGSYYVRAVRRSAI
jgi:hypothetical protein